MTVPSASLFGAAKSLALISRRCVPAPDGPLLVAACDWLTDWRPMVPASLAFVAAVSKNVAFGVGKSASAPRMSLDSVASIAGACLPSSVNGYYYYPSAVFWAGASWVWPGCAPSALASCPAFSAVLASPGGAAAAAPICSSASARARSLERVDRFYLRLAAEPLELLSRLLLLDFPGFFRRYSSNSSGRR